LSADLGIRFYTATDFDFAARTALGHGAQGVVDISSARPGTGCRARSLSNTDCAPPSSTPA